MDIQELAIKVTTEAAIKGIQLAAKGTPVPGAGPVIEILLKELLDVQDQQMTLLTKIEADVQRLVDGPWNTGRRYLRQASLPDRDQQQISQSLQRAVDCFIQAVDLQPVKSFQRASVCLDVALVSRIIGDTTTAGLYATEADAEAAGAVAAVASAYWKKFYGFRAEARAFVLMPATPLVMGLMGTVGIRQRLIVSSALEQYKSVRSVAIILGGNVRDEIPDIQPPSTEFWSERKKREAWEWIKSQAKDASRPRTLPEGKRDK